MKSSLLLLLVLLQLIKVEAQNYKTISSNTETYFINKDGYIKGIKIDTTAINGTDTVYYNFHSIRQDSLICSNWELTPYAPSWLGKQVIIKLNGMNLFFNKYSDTIFIQTLAMLNDSWKLFQFPNGDCMEATVISQSSNNILGVSDSVKTISLQAKDSSGNSIVHPLNLKSFVLSKNFGWTQTFSIYGFPDDTVQYKITDKKRLTVEEVYDFEVGDEMQLRLTSTVNWFWNRNTHSLNRVIAKTYSALSDTVFYQFERKMIIDSFVYNPAITFTRLAQDTILKFYTDLDEFIVEFMPEEGTIQEVQFSSEDLWDYKMEANDTMYNGRRFMVYGSYNFYNDNSDSCWHEIIDGWYLQYTYIEGLGRLVYDDATIGGYYKEELIYYKKDSETYGQLFTSTNENPLTSSSFKFYPNPAQDEVFIAGNFQTSSISQIRIFDVLGNEVLKQPMTENKSINIADLENGFYLAEIISEKGREVKKLVVQR